MYLFWFVVCEMLEICGVCLVVVRMVQNFDDSLYFPGVHWPWVWI